MTRFDPIIHVATNFSLAHSLSCENEMVFDGTNIWVQSFNLSTQVNNLFRIDPVSLLTTKILSWGGISAGPIFDGTNIWVIDYANAFSGVNAKNGTKTGPVTFAYQPYSLVFDGKYLWTRGPNPRSLTRVDPVSLAQSVVSISLDVGDRPPDLFDGTYLWVFGDNGLATRINPVTGVASAFQLPPAVDAPFDVVFDGSNIWFSDLRAAFNSGMVWKLTP